MSLVGLHPPASLAVDLHAQVAALKAEIRAGMPEIADHHAPAQLVIAMAWLELAVDVLCQVGEPTDVLDHVLALLEGRTAETIVPALPTGRRES
jgi:hypothetical protein